MATIQIVGDSQSGNPGQAARTALSALKHRVAILRNDGIGPYDYVRMPDLWQAYKAAVRKSKPALVVLIFGTNDAPNDRLADALVKLKTSVAPKVILSGPPMYPDPERQKNGLKVQAIYREVFGDDFLDAYPFTSVSLERDRAGLHFTPKSAAYWGIAIADEVVRRLG